MISSVLALHAHASGRAVFFDPNDGGAHTFQFKPYRDSRDRLQWILDVGIGKFRPSTHARELASDEFNLTALAMWGYGPVGEFEVADPAQPLLRRNWLCNVVTCAYEAADSGLLGNVPDAAALPIIRALARFYRTKRGQLDIFASTEPLPPGLHLLQRAAAPSAYDF